MCGTMDNSLTGHLSEQEINKNYTFEQLLM